MRRNPRRLQFEHLEERLTPSATGTTALPAAATAAGAAATVTGITTFRASGAQVSWSPLGDRIAYAAKDAAGYYQIHLANPDGSNDVNLTAGLLQFQNRNVGSPSWDPTGRYLVFVAEKASHPGTSFDATPGFGGYSDVWVMGADGSNPVPLTDEPNDANHGVLIPKFSPNGLQITWTERVQAPNPFDQSLALGSWVIHTADLVATPSGFSLANDRSLAPGGPGFYEGYGFSPDGSHILFASDMGGRAWWDSQVFTMDAATGGSLKMLTSEWTYNEHATYTPDGNSIVWMTSTGGSFFGTEWWIMDSDGNEKRQLTDFNTYGSADYLGMSVWPGLVSFSPDGQHFVGDVQTNLLTQDATIKIVDLNLPTVGAGTGLTGTYYPSTTLTGPSVSRTDPTVNFLWGFGPPDPSVGGFGYSVEWTGALEARYSGPNTLYVFADSQVNLWLNGQLLISGNSGQFTTTYSATVDLVAGQMYSIRVDYQHPYWWSAMTLSWSSPGQPEAVIPAAQLYPATAPPASGASAPLAVQAAAVASVQTVVAPPVQTQTAAAPARSVTKVAGIAPKVTAPVRATQTLARLTPRSQLRAEPVLKGKRAGRS